jgi:uroporphyrinogen III methyltransferase/synthase
VTVYLVGAGPGDADLLTLRGAALLARADVVVYDRLIDPAVLEMAALGAELIDVGKRPGHSSSQGLINDLLVSLGQSHDCVVRLKGGDSFLFGRGGEEFGALEGAGVRCEVVPGVTSAFAAPAVAGIPVTHRGLSHGVTVVTGHTQEGDFVDFRTLANPDFTLVVLMGIARRAAIARQLIEGGLDAATPVAVVEKAYMTGQRVFRCVLGELATVEVTSPAVIVIGAVAELSYSHIQSVVTASSRTAP